MKTIESKKPKTAFYWRIRHTFIKNELDRLVQGDIEAYDEDMILNIIKEIEKEDFVDASIEAKQEVKNIQETIRQIKSWFALKAFW